MKTKSIIQMAVIMMFTAGCAQASSDPLGKKALVVYFSHSGNTREIANQIKEITGGDIFEIVPIAPYTGDYDTVVEQAKRELASGHLPALKGRVTNIGQYDVVFIGYPNWWATYPRPVAAFISENDLSGKIIVPFCTHEGSAMGRSVDDLRKAVPRATVMEGLPIRGNSVKGARAQVTKWINGLNIPAKSR